MKHAVLKHGVIKGFITGIFRIGRCVGAVYEGGEDPVPEKFRFKEIAGKYKEFKRKKKVKKRKIKAKIKK